MPKTGPGKDIASKIIDFLRQNGGEAVISQTRDAARFNCSPTALRYSLYRLMEAGIVAASRQLKQGVREPVKFSLPSVFMEGDSWREALKRKSSGGKAEAGPSIAPQSSRQSPETGMHDEKCLEVRKALLEELTDVYGKFKTCQEEKQALHDENENLQERMRELEEGTNKKAEANRQLRQNVQELEERVKKLRVQTSQPPPAGRKLTFDSSGVVVLPSEGLPDKS